MAPLTTTTYTLEVSCLDRPDCADETTVTVDVIADDLPPDLGNRLLAVRTDDNVDLAWVLVPEAYSYALFRGTQKGVWGAPLDEGFTATTYRLPDVPPPESLYFYRVAGESCSGAEGE